MYSYDRRKTAGTGDPAKMFKEMDDWLEELENRVGKARWEMDQERDEWESGADFQPPHGYVTSLMGYMKNYSHTDWFHYYFR